MCVMWLGQADDVSVMGAKAANLHRLASAYRVPPGFCLTTAAFAQWQAEGEPDSVPLTVQPALIHAYRQLAEMTASAAPRVAVRSSALDEDSRNASFAGQYESYLNVAGLAALQDKIVACWRSASAERVQQYRQHAHLEIVTRMAVLVQILVPADVSIVAFSINPITGSRADIVINANWGLGESIVGGLTTPDSYEVNKSDLTVRIRKNGAKERMCIVSPTGMHTVSVPRPMRSQSVLNAAQIREIAKLTRDLEATMGWPVDIECAYKADTLYLLQCRPVTA